MTSITKKWVGACMMSVALAGGTATAGAQEATPVNVSYQVTIHGIPLQIAEDNGWWEEIGISQGEMSSFTGGAQQVAAVPSATWDIGLMGGAPAALGASRFDLQSVLMLIDDSEALALVVRGSDAEAFEADPAGTLRGQSYLTPVNTLGDYAAQVCFQSFGLEPGEVSAINIQPGAIVDAFQGGQAIAGGIWAPHFLRMESQAGGKVVCRASDTGKAVFANMVVRPEYLEENLDTVARFTAMYLRAINVMKADKEATLQAMQAFYDEGGVVLSPEEMDAEYELRKYFNLEEQLALFDRSQGPSEVDVAFEELGGFLQQAGTFPTAPDVAAYINPTVLEYINEDPELKAFAEGM